MSDRANRTVQIYRLVVLLAGFALLVYWTATAGLAPGLLWAGGVIAVFSALQTFFSLSIFAYRYTLLHYTVLACALLIDPLVVGWAALAGMLVGSLLVAVREKNLSRAAQVEGWQGSWSSIGALLLALTLAFGSFGVARMFPGDSLLLPGLLRIALIFVFVHAAIQLGDAWLRSRQTQPGFRSDLIWFVTLELLPLPVAAGVFALITSLRPAWAVVVAALITVLAALLHYFQRAQQSKEHLEQERAMLNRVSQAVETTLEMDRLLSALQQLISRHFGVDSFYVAIHDEREGKIWYPLAVKRGVRQTWSSRQRADRLTDRVIFERQPILISGDASQQLVRIGLPAGEDPPAAWMGVPLRSSDQVFSEADLALFVTLSGQVGVAVANALLYEKLHNRAAQLEALNQFSMDVSRSLDVDRVFSIVCQSVTRVVTARRSAVFILDLEQGMISLAHAHELSDQFIADNRSFALVDDERARCLRSGLPELMTDVCRAGLDPEYEQLLCREGIGATGSFPLASPDGQIGYLALYYDFAHNFEAEELELVQTFAAQAAMAVSNARLHERTDLALSRRVHQLSVLESISRELAAAIHSEQLYKIILSYSMEFTNSTWGMFYVLEPHSHRLQVKAQRGYPEMPAQIVVHESIAYQSVQQRNPINIPDLSLEDSHQDGEARSHLSVPLLYHSSVLGVISLESENKHAFSDNDVAFVGQLAGQAATALQNAQLFAEISSVRDRLSAVINSVHEGILLIDLRGQVVLTNRAFKELTTQPADGFQDVHLEQLPENVLIKLGFKDRIPLLDQLREVSSERLVLDSASGERVLERTMLAVQGEYGSRVGWLLVLRDMTDELRVAQERELISETLIHDLRSPISAVLGALDVVESTLPANDTGDVDMSVQALHIARRGAQRVLDLVENLLDIARLQAGKLELTRTPTDLQKVAAAVIHDFLPQSTEYGVILQNRLPADWPRIFVDQGKIMRVFTNLLDNALKYSPAGTQVTISGEFEPRSNTCIRISDQGPGIPAEYREKIFERFGQIPGARGRRRGTGLGLTFCKLAVEAHGGRIWVEPNAAGGSDFVFTLPVIQVEDIP
ncbi:MAG: GAF domain-containing protein [Anaerolineales bacterium]